MTPLLLSAAEWHPNSCHIYVNAGCTCNARQRAAGRIARRIAAQLIEQAADTHDLGDYAEADQQAIRAALRRVAEDL